jgi:hypothetical protein
MNVNRKIIPNLFTSNGCPDLVQAISRKLLLPKHFQRFLPENPVTRRPPGNDS